MANSVVGREARVRWEMDKPRDIVKLRRWCVRRLLEGWPAVKVSGHAQAPLRGIHRWWSRFQAKGRGGLFNSSRRPHTIHRVPQETIVKVIEVRILQQQTTQKPKLQVTVTNIQFLKFATCHWLPQQKQKIRRIKYDSQLERSSKQAWIARF